MNTQYKHPLTGIGIGPGDPDLITVKGLKALQEADIVFYPASKIESTGIKSHSASIIDAYDLNCECKPLAFPMTGKGRDEFYAAAYKELKAEIDNGKKVVLVSEGDLTFYSTFGYILKLAKEDGVECNLIPGIPAFINAGSEMQWPLVEGDSNITVMARPKSFEDIREQLDKNGSLVVMKMSVLDDWSTFLSSCGRSFFYVEKVGTSEQYSTTDANDLVGRKVPYFSLIVFYN